MSKWIICSSAGYMEERVDVNKIYEVLHENNISFLYWGWLRGEEYIRKVPYPVRHLLSGGGYANKKLKLYYPLWIISVFLNALKLSKDQRVFAVGFDVSLPIYLASKIKKFTYIFDNPDNFSMTYNLSGKINV